MLKIVKLKKRKNKKQKQTQRKTKKKHFMLKCSQVYASLTSDHNELRNSCKILQKSILCISFEFYNLECYNYKLLPSSCK